MFILVVYVANKAKKIPFLTIWREIREILGKQKGAEGVFQYEGVEGGGFNGSSQNLVCLDPLYKKK